MIHFVGAGSGAPDLITVRGQKFLQEADVIIYAGSLVNPELLNEKKEGCKVYNSATMTLEEVLDVMFEAENQMKKYLSTKTLAWLYDQMYHDMLPKEYETSMLEWFNKENK